MVPIEAVTLGVIVLGGQLGVIAAVFYVLTNKGKSSSRH
jgi:hypothetical protein